VELAVGPRSSWRMDPSFGEQELLTHGLEDTSF
jgi:hypothetical protein